MTHIIYTGQGGCRYVLRVGGGAEKLVQTNTVGRAIAGFLRPSGNATGRRLYGDDPSCPSSASLQRGRSSKKDKSATDRQAHVTSDMGEIDGIYKDRSASERNSAGC